MTQHHGIIVSLSTSPTLSERFDNLLIERFYSYFLPFDWNEASCRQQLRKIISTISVALTSPLATIMDTPLFTSLPSTSDGYVDVGVLVDHLQGLGVSDAKVLLAVSIFILKFLISRVFLATRRTRPTIDVVERR